MIAKYIDHTLLKPDAPQEKIEQLCKEAVEHHFASVCVHSHWVKLCYSIVKNTDVKVCSVVGFPLGANISDAKAEEAHMAVMNGASEIDMVMNIGELKSKNFAAVEHDIRVVRDVLPGITLKVIIETCLLNNDEKIKACEIAKAADANFVKTSTGFGSGGATLEDVALMRKTVGSVIGVKASGGIKTYEQARAMIDAGATRLGCPAGVAIVSEEKNKILYESTRA